VWQTKKDEGFSVRTIEPTQDQRMLHTPTRVVSNNPMPNLKETKEELVREFEERGGCFAERELPDSPPHPLSAATFLSHALDKIADVAREEEREMIVDTIKKSVRKEWGNRCIEYSDECILCGVWRWCDGMIGDFILTPEPSKQVDKLKEE
jgi:hypothetical protein